MKLLHLPFVAPLLLLAALVVTDPAIAGCREDHLAADQALRKARASIEKTALGTDAARCASYRRYLSALSGQREVIARCDTGPNQAQNVQAIDTEIATFAQRMRNLCK